MLLLATLVGCNYAGTVDELRGCINDVYVMRQTLIRRFGFEERNITMLLDDNSYFITEPPTGANIKRALGDMVRRARGATTTRAHLFFHFSGHGTLLSGRPYARDHDAIVPIDHNLITDVDFRRLVDQVPETATFTMVSDSCNSGGLIAQATEQIGPATDDSNRGGGGAAGRGRGRGRTRFLSCETVLQRLGAPGDLHQLGRHMVRSFGDDASALFRHARAAVPEPRPDAGILLSGCQSDEESEERDNYGAFTLALMSFLGAPNLPPAMSNWEVVLRARVVLQNRGFTQHPCLYSTYDNSGAPFLGKGRYY